MAKRLLTHFIILSFSLIVAQKTIAQKTYAYITNKGSNTMSIIDVSTNTVVGTVAIGVGTAPYAVAILPTGNAYIANNGSGTVTVFSTTSNTIIGAITVGAGPLSIAANSSGSKVYVTNTTDGTVSVINTATNTVTATITVGGNPQGIVVSSDNSKVYVSDGIAGVAVIDAATNTLITTISTGASSLPKGVGITPDGLYLYVVNSNLATVSVFKTSDNSLVTAPVSVGGGAYGIAISPDGTVAYVTSTGGSISIIRTTDHVVTSTIPDGGGNQPLGVSFTPDGAKVYVVNSGAGNVYVIDVATATITGSPIVVGTNPISFSSFIATVPYTLAIQFTSFTAQELSNRAIQLSWKVQDQTSGTYYEVENSTDGISFSRKTLVNANGSSSASYSWTDASVSFGTNFYRIKSVEASGKIAYSQILKLTIGSKGSKMLVYPNPLKERTFTLQLNNQPQGVYSLQLINSLGQKVFRAELNYTGGSSAQTISLPNSVSKGTYQLVIRNGSVQNVLKLMIE